jgi:uncharacterized protein (DUF433 family)
MTVIVSDDGIRSGSPRIEGTRITVLDVKERVIDNDEDPHVVAGEYDVSLADLFRALAYYYDNRDAFRERERTRARERAQGELRTRELLADLDGEDGEPVEEAD